MNLTAKPPQTPGVANPQIDRGQHRLLRALIVIVFLLAPCGVINHGDGLARYVQTKALVLYHRLSIPPEISRTKDGDPIGGILLAPNGRLYSKYGIGTSLLWGIPLSVAWAIHHVTGIDLDTVAGFGISFVNPVLVVFTAWSMLYALRRLGANQSARFITVFLYVTGTSMLAYANTAFSEPLVGLLLLWAVVLPVVEGGIRAALISGALITCSSLVKPELVPLPACLLPLFAAKCRRGELVAFCLASAVGGLLLALNNLACRGSITCFSYGDETRQFGSPWVALTHQFFGIDRNLFLFNPALLLALTGWIVIYRTPAWRSLSGACLLVWVVYLPFYSSWYAWQGGMCFGPRFFQSFIPLTLLPSGIGLTWLTLKARQAPWYGAIAVALCGFVVVTVPLQIAGLCLKNEEAVRISEITGKSETWTHLQLLALKLRRGIAHPEVYEKSDFTRLAAGEPDTAIDFRSKPTFQYLNHWWSIYLANKIRHTSPLKGTPSAPAPLNVTRDTGPERSDMTHPDALCNGTLREGAVSWAVERETD